MRRFVITTAINALALWVASLIVSGFDIENGFWRIVLVAVIFGLANAFLRPVAKLVALPLIILTMGLFTLVINAVMLLVVDWLMDSLTIDGFGAAFWAALIISVVSWAMNTLVPDRTLWSK